MRFSISAGVAASLLAIAFFASPVSAETAGLTEAQIQSVVDLIESFGADSSIIKNVEDSLRGKSTSSSKKESQSNATSTKEFLKLKAMLKLGSSGDDVQLLQKFLASDPTLYPEGLVTGFFGPLTELAVKRLQAKLKIEQAGMVGPQTLEKLNALLAGITDEDLANSRVKIKIEIKDGEEKIEVEIKCDSSGSGNSCDDSDDDDDEDDDDEEEDDDDDSDDDSDDDDDESDEDED